VESTFSGGKSCSFHLLSREDIFFLAEESKKKTDLYFLTALGYPTWPSKSIGWGHITICRGNIYPQRVLVHGTDCNLEIGSLNYDFICKILAIISRYRNILRSRVSISCTIPLASFRISYLMGGKTVQYPVICSEMMTNCPQAEKSPELLYSQLQRYDRGNAVLPGRPFN
jgi:hypothetical protein